MPRLESLAILLGIAIRQGAEEIAVEHARAARPRSDRDLGELFASRWDDTSRKEREYLAALTERSTADLPATGADVAEALGKGTKEVPYLRDRLIKTGVIWSTTDGELHFITPGDGPMGPRAQADRGELATAARR